MTERIYYGDCYAARFTARVEEVAGNRVFLDRTAFYPTSGGQPHDVGMLGGARVVDVVDEGERIAHVVEGVIEAGADVECAVDWARRWDHMQQHSGQHLLSAALAALYGIRTVSFHMGQESSTIDVEAAAITADQSAALEARANELIQENRALSVSYQAADAAEGLRKESKREGTLRIITIADLDRSACGGTHVRGTGEIGALLIRKTEKIRNTMRIEFLCGMRAVRRARLDYEALSAAARSFSSPLDGVPALVTAQTAKLIESEKARQRLEMALAAEAGRALYRATDAMAGGIRLVSEQHAAIDEAIRARAQAFTEGARSVYLATAPDAASFLLAVSTDAGSSAADIVKPVLSRIGGKGGGTAALAQGKAGSAEGLASLEAEIRAHFKPA
jgi:alanyl-tRNA synthetase